MCHACIPCSVKSVPLIFTITPALPGGFLQLMYQWKQNLMNTQQNLLQNRSVTGVGCRHTATTPMVDHGKQRPQSSQRPHDGAVRGTWSSGGCLRSELTDGLPRLSLSSVCVCPPIGCRTITSANLFRFSPNFACRSEMWLFQTLLFLGQTVSRLPILEMCKITFWHFCDCGGHIFPLIVTKTRTEIYLISVDFVLGGQQYRK